MQPGTEEHHTNRRQTPGWVNYCTDELSLGQYTVYLIRLPFDVKEDGQLVSDTFLHCLLQSWDLLSTVFVPADERKNVFKAKPR